jgi:hypothetical protein
MKTNIALLITVLSLVSLATAKADRMGNGGKVSDRKGNGSPTPTLIAGGNGCDTQTVRDGKGNGSIAPTIKGDKGNGFVVP